MTALHNYLALDCGAESERAIIGMIDDGKLLLSEVYCLYNGPVQLPDGMHWYVLRLLSEIKTGIASAAECRTKLESMGFDT